MTQELQTDSTIVHSIQDRGTPHLVRTLMENHKADRPERRTALGARELARYHVDIAALSETRIGNEGQLTEDGGGYCFF